MEEDKFVLPTESDGQPSRRPLDHLQDTPEKQVMEWSDNQCWADLDPDKVNEPLIMPTLPILTSQQEVAPPLTAENNENIASTKGNTTLHSNKENFQLQRLPTTPTDEKAERLNCDENRKHAYVPPRRTSVGGCNFGKVLK